MNIPDNYLEINKKSWNDRVETHFQSAFYDVQGFIEGKTSLQEIELQLLGDLHGKSVLHLQCHFGQDTISLSRLGAKATGVDFSDKAILKANELAQKTNSDAKFICVDVYDLPKQLNEKFDVVYTSYGTIGWLPDLDKWATVISHFLKPNGVFILVEFHPFIWMYNNDFTKISYDYFNTATILETETATYADKNVNLNLDTVSWNHSLDEVINSLINSNLEIKLLKEYDFSPYNIFSNANQILPNRFTIKTIDYKIPLVYAVKAILKTN